MSKPEIHAAGAVVLRGTGEMAEVLTVHRPRYDDWSLPKGKFERGEVAASCAAREVAEETGIRVRLTAPLTPHAYKVNGHHKRVEWYHAVPLSGTSGTPDPDEVDQVAWLPIETAHARLSYADERERLSEAVALPPVTPLIVLRHAKALPRKDWAAADDAARPITSWGRRQARALVPFLAALGVRRIVSSSAVRCLETVTPYSRAVELSLEGWHELTEESAREDPEAATRAIAELRALTAESGVPTVVCGHRPVLPAMLAALDLPTRKFATAAALVVTLETNGQVNGELEVLPRIGR